MILLLNIFFILCLTLMVYGFPMTRISPPKPHVEESNHTGVNPQELGGGIGGDMIIPGFSGTSQLRGIPVLTFHKWPKNIIPYDISLITDQKDRQMITDAMNLIMYDTGSSVNGSTWRNSCVYFRPRQTSDGDQFFTIRYGTGCNAHVGYWSSGATMTLEKDSCFHSRVIQHELMHVLGFKHEHQRIDRDQYITVYRDNMLDDFKFALDKVHQDQITDLNTPYDYYSVMHYDNQAFSKNGQPTIIPKQNGVSIGVYPRLSPIDIYEVRQFYGCQ